MQVKPVSTLKPVQFLSAYTRSDGERGREGIDPPKSLGAGLDFKPG